MPVLKKTSTIKQELNQHYNTYETIYIISNSITNTQYQYILNTFYATLSLPVVRIDYLSPAYSLYKELNPNDLRLPDIDIDIKNIGDCIPYSIPQCNEVKKISSKIKEELDKRLEKILQLNYNTLEDIKPYDLPLNSEYGHPTRLYTISNNSTNSASILITNHDDIDKCITTIDTAIKKNIEICIVNDVTSKIDYLKYKSIKLSKNKTISNISIDFSKITHIENLNFDINTQLYDHISIKNKQYDIAA